MQKETPNPYLNAPAHYLLCFNATCALADTCLRHLAAAAGGCLEPLVRSVNPTVNGGPDCAFYRPSTPRRMAYGMTHTYDHVRACDVAAIRSTIIRHFGNGSYYLRRNGHQPITPTEQQFIGEVFASYGYADGAPFDAYRDAPEW